MEDTNFVQISDLLQRRRPISGTVSLRCSHPQATAPPPSTTAKTPNSTATSRSKTLISLSKPSIIIGTLSLSSSSSSSSATSSHHSCFSFSDDSASLCCDVLRFDIRMIDKKIRVTGWNFIPFKQCGGLLEIIDWEFVDCLVSSNAGCFDLSFGVEEECDRKAKHRVYGVLKSVSPVSFVSKDSSGFVLEFLCCDCSLCNSKDFVNNSGNLHDFCLTNYVYFGGLSLSWYPVFLKLLGNVLLLVGLRKKLVYIGKEEAQLMFVSSERTSLRVVRLKEKDYICRNGKDRIKGKGELGVYVGAVRGIYMQGMIVELDEEVWLLLTDDWLILPHSVRVGAILSVRNVHIVNPKFQWGKPLILGACCKTNISTISFSPLETGCQLVFRSVSCLGKFLESLVFPARLWVLLLVQCFRKKFIGTFSEKEILGTKHTEGTVQTYARFLLPSSALQSRHGIFMEFCRHNLCASGCNICYGSLSLAMPFSNIVYNCGRICVKSLLETSNGLNTIEGCSKVGHPFQENKCADQAIRRIVPGKEIGVSLLGNLKICSTTGRLQYIDASHSFDAIIPDIPSTWDLNAIYEVFNYNLVIEGTPEMCSQLWVLEDDLFSCSSLLKNIAIERKAELTVYLHFSWTNVCQRPFPVHQANSINCSAKLDPGTFHLIFVAHKFPLQQQSHGDLLISRKSHLYAEVIVLPWDLNIAKSEGAAPLANMPQDGLENGYQTGFPIKRCKAHHRTSCIDKVESCNKFVESGERSFLSLPHKIRGVNNISGTSPVQVHCTVTCRGMNGQCMNVPGILCCKYKDGNRDMLCSRRSMKVLLEFNSENYYQYKLLQIGGSYIMKHCAEKCFCNSRHTNSGSSLFITSMSNYWSLSFHFSDAIDCMSGQCDSSASCSSSENSNRLYLQNGLVLSPCSSADYRTFSNFILHVGADANVLMDEISGFQALKELVIDLFRSSTDIPIIGQKASYKNTVGGVFQNQVMSSGNVLPEGNLITLQGTVVSLQNLSCSIDRVPGNGVSHNICQLPRLIKENQGSVYMLVLRDGHLVEVCGRLSKFDRPVGFGPGAVVTFHRILAYGGQNSFMLTPVSLISVNFVGEFPSPLAYTPSPNPEESTKLCLISDLICSNMCQTRMFHCRIVAVYFVMLERNRSLDKLLSHFHSENQIVNIPLAGFILDDGSSNCCCWTNGDQAATFLRLHEEIPKAGTERSWGRLKAAARGRGLNTPSYQLHRILKKHGRVCLKNYGSVHGILCQDIQLSGDTEYPFGSEDEGLLKFIMLNACSSTLWNVIGHVMNLDAINMLETKLQEEQLTMHALKNVWAKEVYQVNPLAQARALLHEF